VLAVRLIDCLVKLSVQCVNLCNGRGELLCRTGVGKVKANSHIPCRSHAVPLRV
jgi:hypothetical protein